MPEVLQLIALCGKDRSRVLSAALVASIHVLFVWLLVLGVIAAPGQNGHEVTIRLMHLSALRPSVLPPNAPAVEPPSLLAAPPPQIDIEPVAQTVSPPRPDPAHANAMPPMPADSASLVATGRTVVVLLKVFVLRDGTVGDAAVSGSSGFVTLDNAALAYVRAHWRFLPGVAAGQLVADWATVEVLFRRD
jgi:protein TonB